MPGTALPSSVTLAYCQYWRCGLDSSWLIRSLEMAWRNPEVEDRSLITIEEFELRERISTTPTPLAPLMASFREVTWLWARAETSAVVLTAVASIWLWAVATRVSASAITASRRSRSRSERTQEVAKMIRASTDTIPTTMTCTATRSTSERARARRKYFRGLRASHWRIASRPRISPGHYRRGNLRRAQ